MKYISPEAHISPLAHLEDSIKGSEIRIEEGVVIDSFVKLKAAGGLGNVVIGARSQINSGCVLYIGNGITIGKDVLIASNCTFAPTNHAYQDRSKRIRDQGFLPSKGGIVLEDDVWIAANCVLLDGSLVRVGAVVAAGSVVRGELEAYGVYGGNPLRKLGQRT